MQLGQISCGRQNPPVQSAELPSTSLQDWKAVTAPLLPQKRRWYDAGGFQYRTACTKQPRYAPCTQVVGCLGCGGAPNVHRCIQKYSYPLPFSYCTIRGFIVPDNRKQQNIGQQ
ncbi:Hypothetical_protein [Hexamita inflata]|uniref:Hypothetical_protein n=1 Tax=Hexamita inflata TaxID=28002 RepID=A0AA86NTB7_9EUKA|nr:Hypothetical protein HINF_LOCUS12726 [Hexamita inflata]